MTGDVYTDAFNYLKMFAPLFIVIGGLSFADLLITTLINVFKKMPKKWD